MMPSALVDIESGSSSSNSSSEDEIQGTKSTYISENYNDSFVKDSRDSHTRERLCTFLEDPKSSSSVYTLY